MIVGASHRTQNTKEHAARIQTNLAKAAMSDGKDYNLYKREIKHDVDFYWCKDKCNHKSKCTGENSHCEVWTCGPAPINGYE